MALDTFCTEELLNLVPSTAPAASPASNGRSEAFVNTTLRREYVGVVDLSSAMTVLDAPHA
jgi:hypothetical protein